MMPLRASRSAPLRTTPEFRAVLSPSMPIRRIETSFALTRKIVDAAPEQSEPGPQIGFETDG
jgi:hypothetical protein